MILEWILLTSKLKTMTHDKSRRRIPVLISQPSNDQAQIRSSFLYLMSHCVKPTLSALDAPKKSYQTGILAPRSSFGALKFQKVFIALTVAHDDTRVVIDHP